MFRIQQERPRIHVFPSTKQQIPWIVSNAKTEFSSSFLFLSSASSSCLVTLRSVATSTLHGFSAPILFFTHASLPPSSYRRGFLLRSKLTVQVTLFCFLVSVLVGFLFRFFFLLFFILGGFFSCGACLVFNLSF